MCKQVYPPAAPPRKTVQHTAHRRYAPVALSLRSTVIVCCQECGLFLSHFERADPSGIDRTVSVPSHFCACGMEEPDLIAIAECDNAAVTQRAFQLLFDRVGAAVRLADGDKWDAARAIKTAWKERRLWRVQVWMLLQERQEAKVAKLKTALHARKYKVAGEDIADCMIRRLAEREAA